MVDSIKLLLLLLGLPCSFNIEALEVEPVWPGTLILDITQSNSRLLGVGDKGLVVYSDSGGTHWTPAETPTKVLLTAITTLGGTSLWAVGHEGTIIHSDNGGKTWQLQRHEPAQDIPLFDVLFIDSQQGFAVGGFGTILSTLDGGKHWQQHQTLAEEPHLYAITRMQGGGLVVAGEFGSILSLSGDASEWKRHVSNTESTLFGLLSTPTGLYAYGFKGTILFSDNKAKTWRRIAQKQQQHIMAGTVVPGIGKKHITLVSTEALLSGDSSTGFYQAIAPGLRQISSVHVLSPGHYLLAGGFGLTLLTNTP